jgi:hypothetical protein
LDKIGDFFLVFEVLVQFGWGVNQDEQKDFDGHFIDNVFEYFFENYAGVNIDFSFDVKFQNHADENQVHFFVDVRLWIWVFGEVVDFILDSFGLFNANLNGSLLVVVEV